MDDAVHSELVHYLSSQAKLKIKVRREYTEASVDCRVEIA